ncbi:MAG TPA: T9SS type A sorting domain-containing protein, partial [Chitinophagaceae bacterium]|nr:T9SS type A sorting domain-containing protein [Chitinophagaceae bacterium]
VSQAYDGCSGDIPQLPYIGNKDEETTGGSTLLDNAFTIYPNPTSDNIRISNHTIENESIQLEIYSMDGKLLASEKNILFNNSYLVSLNNISTGLYFIKVIRQTGIHTMKFQKY